MSSLAVFNWSGGKDSMLALHYILDEKKYKINCLLTTISISCRKIAMHGVREDLLIVQAKMLKLPLHQVHLPEMPNMETYETALDFHFSELKLQGVTVSIFGDIFLEDLKAYREKQFQRLGMMTDFPLWKKNSSELIREFIALGYKTIVVCAKDGLQDFCGRVIDQSFLDDLPKEIDPCGENGEFHTFVFDGPLFSSPVKFELGALTYKKLPFNDENKTVGYWYMDLIPVN